MQKRDLVSEVDMKKRPLSNVGIALAAAAAAAPFAFPLFSRGGAIAAITATAAVVLALLTAADAAAS